MMRDISGKWGDRNIYVLFGALHFFKHNVHMVISWLVVE